MVAGQGARGTGRAALALAGLVLLAVSGGPARANGYTPWNGVGPPPPQLDSILSGIGWLGGDATTVAAIDATSGAIGTAFGGPGASGGATGFAPERNGVVDEAFAALGYAARGPAAAPAVPLWNVWTEVRGTRLDADVAGSDLTSDQTNVLVGLDRRVTDTMVLGVLAGYENTHNRLSAVPAWLDGEGWSVGSYLGVRLGARTVLEASALYSHVDYDARTAFATGGFEGDRVMAALGLVQTWSLGALAFEPSLRGYVVHERQSAYVDSLGRPTAGRDISVLGLMAGAQVSTTYRVTDRFALVPSVGAYFDWKDVDAEAAGVATTYVVSDGATGRITAGLAGRSDRWNVSLGGNVASLGSGDHVIWTWQTQIGLRF